MQWHDAEKLEKLRRQLLQKLHSVLWCKLPKLAPDDGLGLRVAAAMDHHHHLVVGEIRQLVLEDALLVLLDCACWCWSCCLNLLLLDLIQLFLCVSHVVLQVQRPTVVPARFLVDKRAYLHRVLELALDLWRRRCPYSLHLFLIEMHVESSHA